jgi:CRP-like cAMP-binding protein
LQSLTELASQGGALHIFIIITTIIILIIIIFVAIAITTTITRTRSGALSVFDGYELKLLSQSLLYVKLADNEVVVKQGESQSFFGFVLRGSLQSRAGKVELLMAGNVIGGLGYIDPGVVRSADVMSNGESRIGIMSYTDLDLLRRDEPALQSKIMQCLAIASIQAVRQTLYSSLHTLTEANSGSDFDHISSRRPSNSVVAPSSPTATRAPEFETLIGIRRQRPKVRFRPATAPGYCCHTVVTLLSHCCHTVVALLLHCYYTAVTLLSHCCYTVVTLLLHGCYPVQVWGAEERRERRESSKRRGSERRESSQGP